VGETVGPNITRIELEGRIHARRLLLKAVEWFAEISIGLCGIATVVGVIGNILYWISWVESNTWGSTMGRFNTGWLFPLVMAVAWLAMKGWHRYLHIQQKSDKVLYNAMSGTLAGGK
jgi:hypothetical protein